MFGRYSFLLVAAAICLIGTIALERAAKRTRYRLSDEEYAARMAESPHASRMSFTATGAGYYRTAGHLFWSCLGLLFAWWLLN